MSLQVFNATSKPEAILDAIFRDGGAILSSILPIETIDLVCEELGSAMGRAPLGEGEFWGRQTRRFAGILAKSPASQALCAHPLVLSVVRAILQPYCSSIQLNATQIMQILPGEPEQLLHSDDELWPAERGHIEYMVNTVWALDDITAENGGTRIVPGSHLEPINRNPEPDRVVSVEMPRGSVAIWLGRTVHGGGANISNRPRTALSFAFCLGWLRPAEALYLSHPPAVAKKLLPEVQELLGYAVHAPNLGLYEGQSPHVLLETDTPPDVLAFQDHLPEWAIAALEEQKRLQDA